MSEHEPQAAGALGKASTLAAFAVSLIVIFGLLATALLFSFPSNIFVGRTHASLKNGFNIIASESFPFFTRNPETDFAGVYSISPDGKISNLLITPQAKPRNGFGFSRRQRAQGPELAFLTKDPKLDWRKCQGSALDCVRRGTERRAVKISNDSPVPSICGNVFLTIEKPVPWSYREFVDYNSRVQKIAYASVRCTHER